MNALTKLCRSETGGDASRNDRPVVLITEDDPAMRQLVANVLKDLDAELAVMESSQEALHYLESTEVAVVLTDLMMPKVDGMTVLQFARKHNPSAQVTLMTGYATVDSAVECLKSGAFDYLTKPFDNVVLRHTIERAIEYWRLNQENRRLKAENEANSEPSTMLGRSGGMEEVQRLVDAAAAYDCAVLITGESGCGKELVAREIHSRGPRSEQPFVALNCAAIPEHIIESELFGYQKGAFTGAERAKPGLFESADGGTIFLDEINNASLALQAKMLRVLQDSTFYRLGDTEPREVNARVVAATNRDVPPLIEEGTFRGDLYYRLRVIEIALPRLNERRDDIPVLASYFVSKYARRFDKPVDGMTTDALGALVRYDWPGNVRELENVIQRAIILTSPPLIDVDSLPPEVVDSSPESGRRALDYMQPQTLEEIEIYFIRKTLRETGGDRAMCAQILGIDKSTLWRKIKRYGVEV